MTERGRPLLPWSAGEAGSSKASETGWPQSGLAYA